MTKKGPSDYSIITKSGDIQRGVYLAYKQNIVFLSNEYNRLSQNLQVRGQ